MRSLDLGTMGGELVEFPACGFPDWEDSHEGGQYVMLVVPKPETYGHGCAVDVEIMLSPPDVCHTPNDLWTQSLDEHMESFRMSGDIYKFLTDQGKTDMGGWVLRATDPGHLSDGVLAAVHLGSDCHSRWSEKLGMYWTATKKDLTFRGRFIYDALHAAYDVEPLLLTFLDT